MLQDIAKDIEEKKKIRTALFRKIEANGARKSKNSVVMEEQRKNILELNERLKTVNLEIVCLNTKFRDEVFEVM